MAEASGNEMPAMDKILGFMGIFQSVGFGFGYGSMNRLPIKEYGAVRKWVCAELGDKNAPLTPTVEEFS